MAKAGKLAGLAALAGAAYMMSKDKDKGTTDSNPTRAARPESTETREEPIRKIEDYQAKAPLDGTEMYPSGVMGGARLPSAPKTAKSPAPSAKPATDRRVVSAEEGMANYKPRYTPSAMAPKTTQGATYEKKAYMPEDVDMSIGRKRGGAVKKMASGGMTASRRADGIATKGKTRGKIC